MSERFEEWQAIRLYAEGQQPHTARHWNCLPAWDITSIERTPDGEIPHPDAVRAAANPAGDHPARDQRKFVFWNRHIDSRFHIEYPLASRATPRVQGRTIGDPDREWEAVVAHRDRYLAAAGLTLESPAADIARCLAESFAGYSHFKDKPLCTTFPGDARALEHPVEGLLHQSFCIGCAEAFATLADCAGLAARVLSMGGHVVAEVRVDGRWHLVDSIARHKATSELELYFDSSFVETILDPLGAHGRRMPDSFRDGLWRRPMPRIHLMGQSWLTCMTLHYTAQTARALYPEQAPWGIQSTDGRRLALVHRADGLFFPRVHRSVDDEPTRVRRAAAVPLRMPQEQPVTWDFLYHPFRPGERLRESIALSDLADCEGIEALFTFGASRTSDFSSAAGRGLRVRVGDFSTSLASLGAWPPDAPDATGNVQCRVMLPRAAFRAHAVNWIELIHDSRSLYYVPCVPAFMEPYVPPLWSETADRVNPPAAW